MGQINVRVSGTLLKQALGFDTSDFGYMDVVNIYKAPDQYDTVIITIDNDKFPPVLEGEMIPFANPTIQKETIKIIDWNILK